MQPTTWPSGLEQPATESDVRHDRPLPATVRPCTCDVRPIERAEYTTFPARHVAVWCVLGAIGWIGVIAAGRALLSVLTQLF